MLAANTALAILHASDEVRLRHGVGFECLGGLNSIFLAEEGYTGGLVRIGELTADGAYVRLPSGYRLHITPRDVAR